MKIYQAFTTMILALFLITGVEAREITYPNQSGNSDQSLGYAVLNLALNKSGKDFTLSLDLRPVTAGRVIRMLEEGQVDVIDGGYSPVVANQHELIYLPIDLGLSGWRVFITSPHTAKKLSSVKHIEDLKQYTFGQGQGWYDVTVLEHAGLKVTTPPKLDNLFAMVNSQRFDLLPLGANEAFALLERFSANNTQLVIDKHVALVYPFGRFFYVRKSDSELKQAIATGMNRALDDGSLLSLLKQHPYSKDAFEKANLRDRVQIQIETPNMSKEFKSIHPKWWYKPD